MASSDLPEDILTEFFKRLPAKPILVSLSVSVSLSLWFYWRLNRYFLRMKPPSKEKMTLSNLPDEILTEIFRRLPVKSILRSRGVCRWCRQLLSNRHFIQKNLDTTVNNNEGYIFAEHSYGDKSGYFAFHCQETFSEVTRLDLPPHLPFKEAWVVGNSCGLICLDNSKSNPKNDDLLLWNPATCMFKRLPRPLLHFDSDTLVFSNHGFGYVPRDKDYKLLRFLYYMDGQQQSYKIELYSLKDDSWKIMPTVVPGVIYDYRAATTGGVLYWFARQDQKLVILSFGMANEVFGVIDIPNYRDKRKMSLMVLNGLIALFHESSDNDGFPREIWVYKESWSKKFSFDERWVDCLSSWKNGGLVLKDAANNLVLYEHQEIEPIQMDIKAGDKLPYVTSFVPTLALL